MSKRTNISSSSSNESICSRSQSTPISSIQRSKVPSKIYGLPGTKGSIEK